MKISIFQKPKSFFRDLSIAWKYSIGLISVIAIGSVSVYLIFTSAAQDSLEDVIGRSTSLFAQEAMNKMDRVLLDRIEYWRVYSTEEELLENLRETNKKNDLIVDFEEYVRDMDEVWMNLNSDSEESWMLDIFNNSESSDLRRIINSFEDRYGYRVFGEVFVTDKRGLVSALSNWTSDYYQADELWWQQTMEKGLYVSDVVFDESAQMRAFEIGIRVDDENGEILGVMKVILNVKEAIDVVEELLSIEYDNLGGTFHAKILDNNREIVFFSEDLSINEPVLAEVIVRIDSAEEENNYFLLHEGDEEGISDEFMVWAESKGYKDFPGLKWVLLLEYDAKDIFSPITKLKNLFFVTMLTAVIFLTIYSLFISRLITKPIQELLSVIGLLKEGKKGERVVVRSKDEIGILAKNFNDMADKLMEIDKLKNEFLSLAAHQLRTPLGIIRWNLELLLSGSIGKISKPVKTLVKDMYKSNLRLVTLVNDLLDTSRLDQGRVSDRPRRTNLIEVVELVVKGMKAQAKKKHVTIDLQVKGKIPSVTIDSERFRETMENLISNAVKYNREKGSVKVKIEHDKSEIIFSIKDTGIGILEKDNIKIFSKFFRGSNIDLANITGTGLGLYVVKEYLKGWGGEISYNSSNKGTEFIVKLPKKPKQMLSHNIDNLKKKMFDSMTSGYALHEIVINEKGKPKDYIFKEVNAAFEKIIGLKRENIIGKKVTAVLPGIEKDKADWIGKYGKIALDQEEIRFEEFSDLLKKWYSVIAFSPEKGMFVTIFQDVTELKKANGELKESKRAKK